MEKLELKHLAPYLPYKLKIRYWDRNIVMNAGQGSSTNWIGITAVLRRQGEKQNCYPILRPLSDLTKEIGVDGEKFVPIVELARSNHVLYDDEFEISNMICKDTYCYIDYFDNSFDSQHRFYYDFTGKTFQCGKIDPNEHNSIRNGLDLFNKLFQWHFDVFGLIESGLAIDINTLNK